MTEPACARDLATRTIAQEHINLWRIISLLDRLQKESSEHGVEPDEVLISAILDYFEHFSERVQSGENQIVLFERLRHRLGSPLPELDALEHDYFTAQVALEKLRTLLHDCVARWPQGQEAFGRALSDFSNHLRSHILKEEQLLPRAREILNADDWAEIVAAKDQYDDPLFGERVQEAFRDLRHHIVQIAPEHVGGLGFDHPHRLDDLASQNELLAVRGVSSSYGNIQALHRVDLHIQRGEIVSLVGANGAGKTTLLMALSGLQPIDGGTLRYADEDLNRLPSHTRVARGIVQVPEGRQVFRDLSVHDNLLMGAYTRGRNAKVFADLDEIYHRFPILRQKRSQLAGMLSGGQQQMLAIGRALMAAPRLLLLDEPSMGLAPLVVEEIFAIIKELNEEGITLFLVEQNASQALSISDRGYVLESGCVTLEGSGRDLLDNEEVRTAYLGI